MRFGGMVGRSLGNWRGGVVLAGELVDVARAW